MFYTTRKIQLAYANRCTALPQRLYLDAKINYSAHRVEAAADRRHAKLAKKREEFLERTFALDDADAIADTFLLLPSAIYPQKLRAHISYSSKLLRGTRADLRSPCIICVAPQIANDVSRSSDRRVFLSAGYECNLDAANADRR